MAEVKSEQQEAQAGIKLFGKTIALQDKLETTTIDKQHHPSTSCKTMDPATPQSLNPNNHYKIRHEEASGLEKTVACPRCKSADTKFCYFNNYNVNQPRHFCKGCQRYWTAGGALRNVPVGAGRRRAKPGPPHPPPLFDQGWAEGAVLQGYWAHHLVATANGGYGGGGADFHPAKRRRKNIEPTGQTNC